MRAAEDRAQGHADELRVRSSQQSTAVRAAQGAIAGLAQTEDERVEYRAVLLRSSTAKRSTIDRTRPSSVPSHR